MKKLLLALSVSQLLSFGFSHANANRGSNEVKDINRIEGCDIQAPTISIDKNLICEASTGKITLTATFRQADIDYIKKNNATIVWYADASASVPLTGITSLDPNNFQITILHPSTAGTYSYTASISIPNCKTATGKPVTLTVQSKVTANAGADQTGAETCEKSLVTLSANKPAGTTGKWYFVNADSIGAGFDSPTSPTSTFSGKVGVNYVLKWKLNQSPCAADSANVNVKFNKVPLIASLKTLDTLICDVKGGKSILKAHLLTNDSLDLVNQGFSLLWSKNKITFDTIQFSKKLDPQAFNLEVFSPNVTTTYYVKVNQSICQSPALKDSITIRVKPSPSSANAGSSINDNSTCGKNSISLLANSPSVGKGKWTIDAASDNNTAGVSFSNDTLHNAALLNATSGVTYTVKWTISNAPCAASTDTATIKFNINPSDADAGASFTGKETCGLTSITLAGNQPQIGTGVWTVKSGANGTLASNSDPKTVFSGDAGKAYTLTWTVSNAPCNPKSADINVTFNQNPTVSIAGAGIDGTRTCGKDTVNLKANNPAIGTGFWSVKSASDGDTITPSFKFKPFYDANFQGKAGVSYKLLWTIYNAPCDASRDSVEVKFNNNPSDPIATDITSGTCGFSNVSLNASSPVYGTGLWTITKGNASLDNPNLPTSNLSGVNGDTIFLNWKVENFCGSKNKDVKVIFQKNPEQPAVSNASLCVGKTINLTATTNVNQDWSYQWYKDSLSQRLIDGKQLDSLVILFGENKNTLLVDASKLSKGYEYYHVQVTNLLNNCTLADDSIRVGLEGAISVNLDRTFCNDKSSFAITLNAPIIANSNANTFVWTKLPENTTIDTDTMVSITQTGNYQLSINHPLCGALGPYNFTIQSHPIAEFKLESLDSICLGNSVNIKIKELAAGTPKYKFIWWQYDEKDSSIVHKDTLFNASLKPTRDTTTYILTAIDNNGCISNASKLITAPDWDLTNQPNIFTPNGDEYNQYFKIRKAPETKVAIEIFNRWGNLMYKSDDYDKEWDGDQASDGIYYYTMTPSCPNITIKKWVQIVR